MVNFGRKYIAPYSAILLVTCFVLLTNYAHAQEYVLNDSSDQIMDLNSVEVANVVGAINPYTVNYQEDSVQVALAMTAEDYFAKPMIAETTITEVPVVKRTSTISYTVEGGDTLSSIGWKYGLKIATIKTVNDLSSDTVRPGKTLKLPPEDLAPSVIKQATQKKKVAGASTSSGFRRPTSGWHVSQVFGHTSFESNHTGIDLDSRSGTTIYAAASGKVSSVTRGWGGGYGNHIVISHGNGFSTLYGHLSAFKVSSGEYVEAGEVIGIMGSTGWSTGTHLHFEIRKGGSPVNPSNYL